MPYPYFDPSNSFCRITGLSPSLSDEEAKRQLVEAVDAFAYENIELAAKQISITAVKKIKDGDVILTYGWYGTYKANLL
jgi:translation initiation factor 2B subunit (eIF-2B alpha/beta/delta family)